VPDLAVAPGRRADAPLLARVINDAYIVEQFFIDGDRISAEEVARLMAEGAVFLVARDAHDEIAGCVLIRPEGEAWYLGLLSVLRARQGLGLGRRLLDAAEAWIRAAGASRVDINVVNLRTELFPFYEKHGYVRTGTAPFASGRIPKQPCHLVLMSKRLQTS